MRRRSFLTSLTGTLVAGTIAKQPVAAVADVPAEPLHIITSTSLSMYSKKVGKIFKSVFPQGCETTEENIQKLLDSGINLGQLKKAYIPFTGCFEVSPGEIRRCLNGRLHCIDAPAIERKDGDKYWFLNGKRHREDGPAIEYANGGKSWFLNGKRHREDGPAIECADGTKYWYLNGERHRENGPAIECADGTKYWYLNGERHRENGPAIEYADGS